MKTEYDTRFLLEWKDKDGDSWCLIDVCEYTEEDDERHLVDRWLDLSRFVPDEERWKTEDIISHINEYTGVGLPSDLK